MIEASELSVRLSDAFALGPVSITAAGGEFICLVGPNGAGKSTLLKLLAGVLQPDAGTISVGGDALERLRPQERAKRLAWLPQQRPLAWNMCAEDVAALGRFAVARRRYARCGEADRAAVDAAMEKAGAAPFCGRQMETLSGGEQARVHLARILASEAGALLLDEPCAALDIAHQLQFMETLGGEAAAGRCVIAALHDLDLARRYASRVIVLDKGGVRADGTAETALDAAVLSDVFGVSRGAGGQFSVLR